MAIEVQEAFSLPRIVFLPARRPPHKPERPVTGADHRLAMARAAVGGFPGFEVSDAELLREGPSYSLDTVLEFRRSEPAVEWLFVMGTDSFAEISTWHRYRELLASCDFILVPRPGTADRFSPPEGLRIEKEKPHCYSWTGDSYLLPGGRKLFRPAFPVLDISSRGIRQKVAGGKSIRGLVPPEVESYIAEHRLYLRPGEG
jgi:nicotinate-nucleotide adenylyltransferase